MINKILLWIKHKMRWNTGRAQTFLKDDVMYCGFLCECGKMHNIHKVPDYIAHPEKHLDYWKERR